MRLLRTKQIDTRGRGAYGAAACRPLVVPGDAGAAVGMIGLAAATLCAQEPFRSAWVVIWLIAALAGAVTGAVVIAACDGLAGHWRWSGAVWSIFARLLPALCVGAVLTLVLCAAGLTWMLPGTWLLIYGCALMHLSGVAARGLALLGILFAALAVLAFTLPPSKGLMLLGLGFGELHLLHGVLSLRLASAG
jgi:hypothetical protein